MTGGSGDSFRFELQLFHSLLQARLQCVSPLSRFIGIQSRVRPSRLFLVLQILSAVIPVADFLREAVLHCRLGFGDQFDLARSNLFEMLRHDVRDRVGLRLLLKLPAYPGALRAPNDRRNVGFVGTQRPIVQIGRILEVAGAPAASIST